MNKPLDFKNIKELRYLINKEVKEKTFKEKNNIKKIDFIEKNLSINSIDYYYTNPIARSSKVMNECRQISKKNFSTATEEKAS